MGTITLESEFPDVAAFATARFAALRSPAQDRNARANPTYEIRKALKMVLAFGEHDRVASLLDGVGDVPSDELVASRVRRNDPVHVLVRNLDA